MSIAYPIPRQTRQATLGASGGQKVFGPFDFILFDPQDIEVWARTAAQASFTLIPPDQYTVSPAAPWTSFPALFTISLTVARAAGDVVQIKGSRLGSRTTDVTRAGVLKSQALEAELDKQVATEQELRRDVDELATSIPVDAQGIYTDMLAARDAAAASAAAAAQSAIDAGGLQPSNNLSDVANPATSLNNLGGLAKTANLSDVANPATAFVNLGGLDLSTVVNLTAASVLTAAAFGKLHFITGTANFNTMLPTPVGNAGKTMAFIVGSAANATKLFTLRTPAGSIGRSGASIVMWANESVLLRSNGVDWQVLEAKQYPFVGKLVRNTDVPLTSGVALAFGFSSASGDPTALNLAFDGSKFVAPRAGRYIFALYSYQTSSGANINQAWIGNLAATKLSNAFSWSGSVDAGTVYGTCHLTVAAGDAVNGVANVNGTGPKIASATVTSMLDFAEVLPSW